MILDRQARCTFPETVPLALGLPLREGPLFSTPDMGVGSKMKVLNGGSPFQPLAYGEGVHRDCATRLRRRNSARSYQGDISRGTIARCQRQV